MSDIAISVRNVSKCYRVFEDQRSRLLHAVWPRHTKGMQEIWALRDIDFEVRHGEAVAIIGRNGGGKSTLLEILTGTLSPTTGDVKVNGRVSALLELGSGFNPEYTGRDNVILNGLLLGLSREEIHGRFDEIEAFAEIGAAIDRPVKTYSSGMTMRLAFAVQVLCEPDILIVDEALSVGDYFFQQRCFSRLRKMRDEGLTLLFVSHDMGTVRDLCSKALYLVNGANAFFGDSKEAVRTYLAGTGEKVLPSAVVPCTAGEHTGDNDYVLESATKDALWRRDGGAHGSDNGWYLLAVVLRDQQGQPASAVKMGSKLVVQVFFRTPHNECGHISLVIKNKYDQIISNIGSLLMGMDALCSGDSPYGIFEIELDCMIEAGLYSLMVAVSQPNGPNRGQMLDSTEWFGPLRVDWDYESEPAPFLGLFGLPVCGRLTLAQSVEINDRHQLSEG